MPETARATVVVTGGSSGIGAEAAGMFAELGARVTVVGSSAARTAAVADAIGGTARTVDFTRLADVVRLAAELREELGHIDVLAANAGRIDPACPVTGDGIEVNAQVNAIAPWLLTQQLAPALVGGRVVSTSSSAHVGATVAPDRYGEADGARWPTAYGRAKLVGGILLREFGRRHPETTVVDFNPGATSSDFNQTLTGAARLASRIARPFLAKPAAGARHLVALAVSDEVDGGYHDRGKAAPGSPLLGDRALATALWHRAAELTGTA
jgi:NAD(P)-dependent dehydrogenase (short-subunit alcohol dehydrogenase family)